MHKTAAGLSLSATDLSNSLACRQLTGLDMSVALEGRKRPYRNDPLGDILAERGLAHEKAYAFHLKAQGRKVLDLSAIKDPADAAATLEAMRAGHDVIVQGALLSDDGRWYGRPDVLLRTENRGTWPWSYEAVDTKLAQETRGGTILQLSFYSDLLHIAQGTKAEHFHVVTPRSGPAGETYRTADYAAWFRSVGTRIEDTTAQTPSEVIANSYPEPIDHCDLTSRSWRTRPAARDASWKQTASPGLQTCGPPATWEDTQGAPRLHRHPPAANPIPINDGHAVHERLFVALVQDTPE